MRSKISKFKTTALLLIFMATAVVCLYAKAPLSGPVQNISGPGGSQYFHESLTKWESGKKHERYEVFEPANPTVKKAGFVLMIHDRMTGDPEYYMGHIRHLCRRGWVVVFPRYQGTDQQERHYGFNIIRSVKDFMLKSFARQKIELDNNKFAIIGNGIGAVLSVNIAASADYFGLPKPLAIMPIMPDIGYLKLLDLSGMSRETKMIVISGDGVEADSAQLSHDIFYKADRIKTENKVLVYVLSDFYGQPPLIANRLSALSPEKKPYTRLLVNQRNVFINTYKDKFNAKYMLNHPIDTFDWLITFRLFDILTDLTFENQTDLSVLKKSKEIKSLGYWSDGKKLTDLIITDRP